MDTPTLPKVIILTTGGTIASLGVNTLDIFDYNSGMLNAEALLARIPEVKMFVDPILEDYGKLPSHAIGPKDWVQLVSQINSLHDRYTDIAGVVVTHGTATLEETAYFLHLTAKLTVPIVVVGAQRPITGISSDGPLNLVNAVRVAAANNMQDMGVMVVMNDEIHCARDVSKRSVFRLNAFETSDLGVLGHTDPDRIEVYRRPTRKHTNQTPFSIIPETKLPRVDIVAGYAGADDVAINSLVEAGAKGLILETHPPGIETPEQTHAVQSAIQMGVVVVYTTRAGRGKILPLSNQQVPGCLTADNLTSQKARVLLMLALTKTPHLTEIAKLFREL